MVVFVIVLFGLAGAVLYARHKKTVKQWEKTVPVVKQEMTEERVRTLSAFENYMDFRPLPDDKSWMLSHCLISPTRRGKYMLSSKGLYILRTLGFNVF